MSFVRDLRFAVLSLARTPGLACAVILTLALGIGANAAIFTLVRGVLLRPLLTRVLAEGAIMASAGVIAGTAVGFICARLAGKFFLEVKMPGLLPMVVSAFVLMAVAVVASVLSAARAARVDVMQALRSE